VIVGDVVSPRERGRYMGYIGSVFALASVGGPLVGGYFVDNLTWRWVFYINVPVGIVALVVTNSVLRLPFRRVDHAVDYLGAALLVCVVTSAVLVTSWGGTQFAWTSPVISALGGGGVAFLAVFLIQERRSLEPILPLQLFGNSIFVVANVAGFLVGATMFGSIVFLPLFLQLVTGVSATSSGLLLLPLMAGLVLSSVASGRVITRFGRYRVFPIVGTAIMSVGVFLLSRMGAATTQTRASLYMAILGIGIGAVMQVLILAVQNSVARRDLGIATATASLFRSLGGAVGTAAFGAVLTNRLAYFIPRTLSGSRGIFDPSNLEAGPAALRQLPPAIRGRVVEAFAHSIQSVFQAALPVAVLGFVVVLLLQERPLRDDAHIASAATGEESGALERAAER
jgi:MFS family permease